MSLLCLSISLLLVRVSGIMLQNPGFILRITPLAPAALKVVLLLRSSRVEFLTSPEIFDSLLAVQSSLTRLKNAIITMRPRARSELLSVALLDSIALSLSSFLVKVLAHGSVMTCENTKIITKGAATELEKESVGSIIGEDWSSIQFQSAAPKQEW